MTKTEATWAGVLSGVSATYIGGAGHVVRLTAHGARADILILAEQSGDFASLFPSAGTGV